MAFLTDFPADLAARECEASGCIEPVVCEVRGCLALDPPIIGDHNGRRLEVRREAENAANRSLKYIQVTAKDILGAPIFAEDADAAICAVGVKHGLNIHPAIARDIVTYLRGPFGEVK